MLTNIETGSSSADTKSRGRNRTLIVTVVCVLLIGGCTRPHEQASTPSVFLISLDTVRRDAVGVYRETGPSPTPELDRFASSCVVFDQAWAPIPFTLPSHMSLFTGLHPEAHGVVSQNDVLDPRIPSLSELSAAAGYLNIGLVSNIWMKGIFGFARGFDLYERIPFGLTYADRINNRLFSLLDHRDRGDDRPIFAFLHYIDAHSDYHKAGSNTLPYYSPPERLAELGIDPVSREFCDSRGRCATKFLTAANRRGYSLDQPTIDRIAALYGAGVQELDRAIGDLLRGLEERGLLDDSLIVITADHGEEFREHGRFVHAQPYVECLAVPLLVHFPDGQHAGLIVDDAVELSDLMPSILVAMGADVPGHVPSRDLFSPILAGSQLPATPLLGSDKNLKNRFSLRTGSHTLILDLDSAHRKLYDRSSDPDEQLDVAASHTALVAELEEMLREMVRRSRESGLQLRAEGSTTTEDVDVLSGEEADHLRAIGYLE